MLKIGDRVEVIDEALSGRITQLTDHQVVFESDEGFELSFPKEQVVRVSEDIPVYSDEVREALDEKEIKRPHKSQPKKYKKIPPPLEVDLHIHHIVKSTKNLTNFDMLNIQLDTAKQQLNFAIKKRIQRVVFIHGVGEGVLRQELITMLRRYDNLKFYDASYQKYGVGATEVYIFQNNQ